MENNFQTRIACKLLDILQADRKLNACHSDINNARVCRRTVKLCAACSLEMVLEIFNVGLLLNNIFYGCEKAKYRTEIVKRFVRYFCYNRFSVKKVSG